MPDLSNLLGAVYGDTPSPAPRDPEDEAHVEREAAAEERGAAVPDWANDERLDAAFAQWKPGPSADASQTEHAFAGHNGDDPPPPLADDLAAALSEALVASSGVADDTDDGDDAGVADGTVDDGLTPRNVDPDDEAPAPNLEAVHERAAAHDDVDHLRRSPAITSQRAAAAELTAASRVDPEPVVTPPAPQPEAVVAPVASAPAHAEQAAVTQGLPVAVDTTMTPKTGLPGARRWDRSDDDILPAKQSKKFFSLSLRRG
ncbi:MAG: hypothetical protein JO050_02930 [Acidimicrobiia bacterium]|nr:hypothetical protein [Acidimicrobiia bacterium]